MEKRIILSVFQIKARKRRVRSGVATAGLCGHSTWQTRTVAYSADRRSAQRVQRLPEAYIYLHQRARRLASAGLSPAGSSIGEPCAETGSGGPGLDARTKRAYGRMAPPLLRPRKPSCVLPRSSLLLPLTCKADGWPWPAVRRPDGPLPAEGSGGVADVRRGNQWPIVQRHGNLSYQVWDRCPPAAHPVHYEETLV